MEDRKELTKELLTSSFKELMMQVPFEKITIKMITDKAGVIRPTFYKHFQDKYEVLEWILQKDIAEKIQVLIDNDMEDGLFLLLCRCLDKDRKFYKKAYEITGQNSFESMMQDFLYQLLLQLIDKYPLKHPEKLGGRPKESIARFYMFGLTDSIKYWILESNYPSVEEINEAYQYLMRNSILDIVEYPNSKKR